MMLQALPPAGPVVGLVATFRAPRDEVFETWTNPDLIRKWFFAEAGFRTDAVEVEVAPLGRHRIVITPSDGGDATTIRGNFIEVTPGRRLVYTWTGTCAEEQYWTLVSVAFEDAADGSSRIELTHGVFRTDADRAMHEHGWLTCVAALGRLLESD
jgi:uncharacterized protein YndB with AHSA1/START domain